MKRRPLYLLQLSFVASATVVLTGVGSAAESTTQAPDPGDWSGSDVRFRVTSQKSPNEKGFNTMAGVGALPSRAEREKQRLAGQSAEGAAARAPLTAADRQFLQTAVRDGVKEVHLAEFARKQGRSSEVKLIGNRIVAERAKLTNQLMGIAVKNGVQPNVRPAMQQMTKEELANFDGAWLRKMTNDHQQDLAAFSRHAAATRDAELKALLSHAVPTLQQHLALLRAAQKNVVSSATGTMATAPALKPQR